jgi:hypothetical protein
MDNELLERLCNSATMIDAEQSLLRQQADAIPLLASVLSGDAKNSYGVPYRSLGLPLRCALEVAIRLGPAARPLESLLREELRQGNFDLASIRRTAGYAAIRASAATGVW